jgi:hypothetical protein
MNDRKKQVVFPFYVPFALPGTPGWDESDRLCDSYAKLVSKSHRQFQKLFTKAELKEVINESKDFLAGLETDRAFPASKKKQLRRGAMLEREMELLAKDAAGGDFSAARVLIEVALKATSLLAQTKAVEPTIFGMLVKWASEWPVIICVGGDNAAKIQRETVGLGEVNLKMHGINSAAFEKWEVAPARKWAFAIKTVLLRNWMLHQSLLTARTKFKTSDEWDQSLVKMLKNKCEKVPNWAAKCASLPDFARDTVPQWMAVGKEMLKDQMPDFDNAGEWRNWNRRAETRTKLGNSSRSKKRNDIFDSIQSAMETMARSSGLPKTDYQNPVTHMP